MPVVFCAVCHSATFATSGFSGMKIKGLRSVFTLLNAFQVCVRKGEEVTEQSNAAKNKLLQIEIYFDSGDSDETTVRK